MIGAFQRGGGSVPRASAQILPQSQRDLQRSAASSLRPVTLQLRPTGSRATSREPVTVRLRVLAARDYRAQTLNWQTRFRLLLSRINRHTEAWPGVRFEVAETRDWEVDTQERPLGELLRALQAQDSGEGVDWVVGLAAAVPKVPESIHTLGMAPLLSRHFILRSLHDLAEHDLYKQAFDQMSPIERDTVLSERKIHKEQVVFLHEWVHSLGGIHAVRADLIMSPLYHSTAARFDSGNARIIEWAVAGLAARGPEWREPAGAELQKLLSDEPGDDWDPAHRDETLAYLAALQARRAAPSASRTETGPGPETGPGTGPETRTRARSAEAAGASSDLARCLATRSLQGPDKARAVLSACSGLESADSPWPLLLRAEVYIQSKSLREAEAELEQARERLERSEPEARRPEPWAFLATLYRQGRWPSLAAAAAQHADPQTAQSVAAWAQAMRRRLALPSDAAARGLPAAREREYLEMLEVAEVSIRQRMVDTARMLTRQMARAYPELPAGPLLRCELELSQSRLAEAAAACEAALGKQEDASTAHLLLGLIASRRPGRARAVPHLRRAIELDPDTREAWSALAAVLRQSGERAALQELESQYEKRFGAALGR